MRIKELLMKKMTMSLIWVACSFALSACGGGSAETLTTVFKELDYVACVKPNPVPEEVKLIADTGIHPVKRRCNHLGTVTTADVPQCGQARFFSYSLLDVLPSDVAKAKSIGYSDQLPSRSTWDPVNDFACD